MPLHSLNWKHAGHNLAKYFWQVDWLVALAALILMLHATSIIFFRQVLEHLRWVPFILLTAFGVIKIATTRRLPRRLRSFDITAIAFLLWALLSAVYSFEPMLTFLRAGSVALVYAAVFGVLWQYADEHGERLIVRALISAVAILVVLNFATLLFWHAKAFPYNGRLAGWMENPNAVAGLMALAAPLALYFALETSKKAYRLLFIGVVLSLILTQSRTELFAALIGSGAFALWVLRDRKAEIFIGMFIIICLHLGWTILGPALQPVGQTGFTPVEYPLDIQDLADQNGAVPDQSSAVPDQSSAVPDQSSAVPDQSSAVPDQSGAVPDQSSAVPNVRFFPKHLITFGGRVLMWVYGIDYLLEKPWIGYGFGLEEQLFRAHGVRAGQQYFSGEYFHNSYLGTMLQLGIPAGLLLIFLLGALLFRELRVVGRQSPPLLRTAMLGVLITGIISSFFGSWLLSMGNAIAFPFWTIVMLLVRSRESQVAA